MINLQMILRRYKRLLEVLFVLFCVYLISFYDKIIFHTLSEMLGVVVLVMVFVLTWHARKLLDNGYFFFVGISFLFIGFITFFHALAYIGLGVFQNQLPNLPIQIWIASRYYLAFTFLIAPLFIGQKKRLGWILFSNIFVFSILMLSILCWRIFPTVYIEGGLTMFKVVSEYLVIFLFLSAMILMYQRRRDFDSEVYRYIQYSIFTMALFDFVFTFQVGVFGSLNIIGHLLGVISYYIIYLAMVKKALVDPQTVLYKRLKDSENALKESEHKYRALVDLSPESILVHNFGVMEYLNFSARKLLGYEDEESYLGKSVFDFVHPDYADVIKKRVSSLNEDSRVVLNPIEVKLVKRDKTIFVAEVQSAKFFTAGKAKIQTIISDITERKEVERAKTEFVALTSHQLKTPLASMMLAIDLLRREVAGPVNDDLREYLDDLHESVTSMNNTIKSLLNVSKFELGTLVFNKEEIDVGSSINEIVGEFRSLAEKSEIDIKVDLDDDLPIVCFDKSALRLILENLISNAIRYSQKGRAVTVRAGYQSEKILLSVIDNGCGIPEKDKNDIFVKCFRADNAKKISNAGSGMGLCMIKSIVEKMGAKIWFESKENIGTTFYVLI